MATVLLMRSAGTGSALLAVVVVAALAGCDSRPPYPQWCSDLDQWMVDVHMLVEEAETADTPEQSREIAASLKDYSEPIDEYSALSGAWASLIGSLEEAAPGADGQAERRTLSENVMDAWGDTIEPCPGPYY